MHWCPDWEAVFSTAQRWLLQILWDTQSNTNWVLRWQEGGKLCRGNWSFTLSNVTEPGPCVRVCMCVYVEHRTVTQSMSCWCVWRFKSSMTLGCSPFVPLWDCWWKCKLIFSSWIIYYFTLPVIRMTRLQSTHHRGRRGSPPPPPPLFRHWWAKAEEEAKGSMGKSPPKPVQLIK